MNSETKHSNSSTGTISHAKVAGIIAGCLAVAGMIAAGLWAAWPEPAPRLNDDTVSLAKYVASDAYGKLSFERQEAYMKIMEDREDNGDLKRAFGAGKLQESEYRAAIQEAWLGEQLKRSEKYAILPSGPARTKFIRDLVERKAKKPRDPAAGAASTTAPAGPDDEEDGPATVKRDSSATQMRIASWPAPVREQYETFRKDYEAAKEAQAATMKPAAEPVKVVERGGETGAR